MPVARRRAQTIWTGDVSEGGGVLTLITSNAGGEFPVSLPARTADADRSQTNPEELIAGAHSSCYAMAFSNLLTQQGTPPQRLDVTARVTLDRAGEGLAITESQLTVTGVVPGLDQDAFAAAAEQADRACPVSNALRGSMQITVEATLKE